jgi:hypothetical protein
MCVCGMYMVCSVWYIWCVCVCALKRKDAGQTWVANAQTVNGARTLLTGNFTSPLCGKTFV